MGTKYHIVVRSIRGDILTFSQVKEYRVEDGLLIFEDSRTKKIQRFAVPNCEIKEESS